MDRVNRGVGWEVLTGFGVCVGLVLAACNVELPQPPLDTNDGPKPDAAAPADASMVSSGAHEQPAGDGSTSREAGMVGAEGGESQPPAGPAGTTPGNTVFGDSGATLRDADAPGQTTAEAGALHTGAGGARVAEGGIQSADAAADAGRSLGLLPDSGLPLSELHFAPGPGPVGLAPSVQHQAAIPLERVCDLRLADAGVTVVACVSSDNPSAMLMSHYSPELTVTGAVPFDVVGLAPTSAAVTSLGGLLVTGARTSDGAPEVQSYSALLELQASGDPGRTWDSSYVAVAEAAAGDVMAVGSDMGRGVLSLYSPSLELVTEALDFRWGSRSSLFMLDDGTVLVGGSAGGSGDFGVAEPQDWVQQRYDATLTLLAYGSVAGAPDVSANDYVQDVWADVDGSAVAVGITEGALVSDGHIGDSDAFVVKFGADHEPLWTQQFGTSEREESLLVAGDDAGNTYVAGVIRQSPQAPVERRQYLVSFDAEGLPRWLVTAPDDRAREPQKLVVSADGSLYVAGTQSTASDSQREVYLERWAY